MSNDQPISGLIPVETPPYPDHSPVSPLPPPSETTNTYHPSTGSEKPQTQPDHAAPVPVYPEGPAKAYPGQPGPEQFQQPHMYYTPYGHPSGYATATPLHSLQSASCPVDCPSCGCREMTRVEPVSGSTTQ